MRFSERRRVTEMMSDLTKASAAQQDVRVGVLVRGTLPAAEEDIFYAAYKRKLSKRKFKKAKMTYTSHMDLYEEVIDSTWKYNHVERKENCMFLSSLQKMCKGILIDSGLWPRRSPGISLLQRCALC